MRPIFILFLIISGVATAEAEKEPPLTVNTDYVQCQVRPGFGHITSGGRCFYNEVMTGIESTNPLMVRCADLQAQCTEHLKEETPEKTN